LKVTRVSGGSKKVHNGSLSAGGEFAGHQNTRICCLVHQRKCGATRRKKNGDWAGDHTGGDIHPATQLSWFQNEKEKKIKSQKSERGDSIAGGSKKRGKTVLGKRRVAGVRRGDCFFFCFCLFCCGCHFPRRKRSPKGRSLYNEHHPGRGKKKKVED